MSEAKEYVPVPTQLIERYAHRASVYAVAEQLSNGDWFATIPGFSGVWSSGDTEKEALAGIGSVVRDWATLKYQERDEDLPVLDGIDLNVPKPWALPDASRGKGG